MKILYNLASRSRPDKLIYCIENIISLTTSKEDYVILVTLDIDDNTVANRLFYDKIKSYGESVLPIYGFSKNKIDAINKNINIVKDWDILVNTSDDMVFLEQGFDKIICDAMENIYPDNDGFLHFNDGNQSRLATMTIEGRKYFDRFGYVYHPDYISLFADNEAQEVSKILNKYHYMGDGVNILKHQHPMHDPKFKMDAQYTHTESFYETDRKTYLMRKGNNFGL